MEKWCDLCERTLPKGCMHLSGEDEKCQIGPRKDSDWIVGMAVWKDLTDRRGVKRELEKSDDHVKVEIIETIGRKAIAAMGRARYGTPLQAGNGRDALVDAYQEALDLCVYLRQAIEERK